MFTPIHKKTRLTFLLFVLVLVSVQPLYANTKADADSAYVREKYTQAVTLYHSLLERGESAEIFYNLGNCYYRLDSIGKAVLYYERAARLAPRDAAIHFNLELARSKTVDKITPEREMFIVTWFFDLLTFLRVDEWAYVSVFVFVVTLSAFILYLFARTSRWKKVGFFTASVCFFLSLVFAVFAYRLEAFLQQQTGAVVMVSSATVKSTPNASGTDLFVLHEGTRVTVTDAGMKGWKEIRLSDGKQGWLKTNQIEII